MSDDSKKDEPKKDLTGILELSGRVPPPTEEEIANQDPFAVNTLATVEQIDNFESINDLGMMDHAPPPEETPAQDFATTDAQPTHDGFAPLDASFAPPDPTVPETPVGENFSADFSAAAEVPPHTGDAPLKFDLTLPPEETSQPSPPQAPAMSGMDEIKKYAERAQETSLRSFERVPYHLLMKGTFDPFARDKLLLFINENPIGLNSSELDRQITAGRVLFPRISEFAGIKLIQDLRDSELSFQLTISSRDADEFVPPVENLRVAYDANGPKKVDSILPVLPDDALNEAQWKAFDTVQLVQFLKAEMVEVERSDLFQDLIDRMTTSLKRKAALKGANAIGALKHELKPLRLPSEYQACLSATLYKKL